MKKMLAIVVLVVWTLSAASIVLAASTGYEGQPGNQSGNTGATGNPPSGSTGGSGNTGYEGQPGNQSSGGK
jgi:hypothetical protein